MNLRADYNAEWHAILNATIRCTNPAHKQYKDYGGRGISVHAGWMGAAGFPAFLSHIGPRPSKAHTLDRIDNDKGYEPGNVRWATRAEQSANRRPTRSITYNGERLTHEEWAARYNLNLFTLKSRVRRGWKPPRLFDPVK